MDRARANEAKTAGAADDHPERLLIAEIGDRADKSHRHDPGGASREQHLLLGVEQPLRIGLHPGIGGEVLRTKGHADDAGMGAGDLRHLEEAAGGFHQHIELHGAVGDVPFRFQFIDHFGDGQNVIRAVNFR